MFYLPVFGAGFLLIGNPDPFFLGALLPRSSSLLPLLVLYLWWRSWQWCFVQRRAAAGDDHSVSQVRARAGAEEPPCRAFVLEGEKPV